MKKIYSIILLLIFVFIIIIIFINSKRYDDILFYSIKEAKGYILNDDKRLHIDIYSNKKENLIMYKDENIYQIKDSSSVYNLENVDIYSSKINDYYVNRIEADLINCSNNLIIEDAILSIINKSFKLEINIGYINILNPIEYELLSFNCYYGSYSYINGELMLVGINLELTDTFHILKDFNVGGFSKGDLNKIKYNLYDNEIDIKNIIGDYNPFYLSDNEVYLKSNIIFIPICYKNLLMIKESYVTLNLDGIDFYIDNLSFISNFLDINDYKNIKEEGKIFYAES